MKNSSWTVVLVVLVLSITPLSCYKILFMLPFSSKSHKFALDPVGLELAKRGHDVTFFSGVESIKDTTNVHNILDQNVKYVMENCGISFFDAKATDGSFVLKLGTVMSDLVNATYSSTLMRGILEKPLDSKGNPKYDLLVVDTVFNEFTLPLAQRMGIPAVYLSPGGLFPAQAWTLNIPHPYSYIPASATNFGSSMSFKERCINVAVNIMFMLMRNYYIFPNLDEVIHRFYPEALPITELERKVSFVLANSHFSIHHQIPSMPYFVEVGGLNLYPAKKLPKELDDFMLSSGEHGVVYFSLGSYTKGESMPPDMKDKLIAAFEQLPQKVLWKYEQDIEGLPKNIKLTKWAPQQDLLGHPKMRLFITHGGGMSTLEAAYHGCPIIGFPLSADQEGNIASAVKKGYGESFDWKTFSADDLVAAIKKITNNNSHKETVTRISTLLKDRPQPPVETAAYWIEYVIRHKGAPHLKSGAENLNFFQYFLLDVIGAVALVLFVVLRIVCFVLRKILGYFGINICPFSLCQKICPSDVVWCPAQKPSSKGHKKKE